MSDLFHAAIKGDVEKVKKILSVYKVLVNDVDQVGEMHVTGYHFLIINNKEWLYRPAV